MLWLFDHDSTHSFFFIILNYSVLKLNKAAFLPRGGTPLHYLYGYVPPNGVVILKLLIWNGVSISEEFSRAGYNISNARKLQFCKQPFEIIQGQIAFKNTDQCVHK